MNKRSNWEEFKKLLKQHNITKLYHFTDRDNLENKSKTAVSTHGRTVRSMVLPFPSQAVAVLVHCRGRSTRRLVWSIMFASASPSITL